jgi:TonB family protein
VKDGLVGPVRRVRTEIVKLSNQDGRMVEGKRIVLEVAAYDIKGKKIENRYFPVAGVTLTGKEVYKYDEKGNISEMRLLNDDGSLLSREVYKYEFDFAGNWNKMTTSVAVVDGGKASFEPSEVTYRSIMYYLDENMIRMVQPGAQPSSSPASQNIVAKTSAEPKIQPVGAPTNVTKQPAGNQKASSLLPTLGRTDKLDGMNSVEVKNASVNANTKPPVILLDSEPPPMVAQRPILKPVSGGVLNGTAITLPAPMYPDAARRMRVSGVVVVEVIVDETGKVVSAIASSGPASLRETAVQAALRARFSPTKLSGRPVKVAGIINYKFSLSQ